MTDQEYSKALNAEQKRIVLAGFPFVVIYLLAVSGVYTYLDIFHYEDPWYYFLGSSLSWIAGYILTVGLMGRSGYFEDGKKSGVGTYFVLGFVTSMLIFIGLLLFVLPGLYLAIRWLPAFALALQQGPGIERSLAESWEITRSYQKRLALALIGPIFLSILAIGLGVIQVLGPTLSSTTELIGFNSLISVIAAWCTILGIAVLGVANGNSNRNSPT